MAKRYMLSVTSHGEVMMYRMLVPVVFHNVGVGG